jgi:hypothetical protein
MEMYISTILDLGTRWRRVVSFTPWLLDPQGYEVVPEVYLLVDVSIPGKATDFRAHPYSSPGSPFPRGKVAGT